VLAEKQMEDIYQGLKVMVIDDSKTIRRTAETLLKKVGCDVVTASDGFEALSKIADNQPEIIFKSCYPVKMGCLIGRVGA